MENKKIGILTYHYSDNYGALLQTYSLSKLLEEKGYTVDIINIVPHLNLTRKIRKFFKDPLTKEFKKFRNEQINTYPKKSFTYKDITKHNFSNYYAIIVGSDQVWRKSYTEGLAYTYFLDFVPENVKRISYAASFGLDYYEGNETDIDSIKVELQKFSLITNREQTGVEICKNTFNVKSECVLDPVLLAEENTFSFNKDEAIESPFITQYLLDPTEQKLNVLKKISNTLNLPIHINYKKSNKKITLFNSIFSKSKESFPSVYSWISGIKNSNYIVTDSFHGVAFSILFEKQFICIVNEKRGKSRMLGLLEQVGLINRAIYDTDLEKFDMKNYSEIDYSIVTPILSKLKNHSILTLINNL